MIARTIATGIVHAMDAAAGGGRFAGPSVGTQLSHAGARLLFRSCSASLTQLLSLML